VVELLPLALEMWVLALVKNPRLLAAPNPKWTFQARLAGHPSHQLQTTVISKQLTCRLPCTCPEVHSVYNALDVLDGVYVAEARNVWDALLVKMFSDMP
jgi:hypothetical protein